MKAAVLHSPGVPEQFRLEERPVPTPAAGQVLLRVRAFGLNRSELMTRKGLSPGVQFPRVLGIECVGEVVQDPSGKYQPGQQVAALMGGLGRDFDGSYAEYTVVPNTILYPFRSQLPWAQLGAASRIPSETSREWPLAAPTAADCERGKGWCWAPPCTR
ncbi:MAG: hypothetical protein EOO62_09430, partial [Hymenobacter sp.]